MKYGKRFKRQRTWQGNIPRKYGIILSQICRSVWKEKTFLQYAENQSYENQYRFILQTGLRTGELVGLKWKDIDLKSKTIQIRRSMEYRYSAKEWRIGEPKSKSGYRTIPLTEEAVVILKKQKEKNKRISEISTEWEEFVFLCRKGTPVKQE